MGAAGHEPIQIGREIRELERLNRIHGQGCWRKRKGLAMVRMMDGSVRRAEIHWYEAAGVGRREFKIKRFLEQVTC